MSDEQNNNTARTVLLAAAHAAGDALKTFEAVMAEHENAWIGATIALPLMAIRPAVGGMIGMIEDRLPPVERTPETALRAMLRAYEAATFDACLAYFQAEDSGSPEERSHHERARLLHRQCDVIRREAAGVAAGYPDPVGFDAVGETSDCLMADYIRRLDGSTPLDAPPAEAP